MRYRLKNLVLRQIKILNDHCNKKKQQARNVGNEIIFLFQVF